MRRLSLVVVLLTLAVLKGGAQAPAPQPPATDQPPPAQPPADQPARPTFKAGVDFVRVDVIVTNKKGEPIVDLKPEEVEVFEDGQRQDVESFKLFKVDEISETTPARPIRSLFDEESEAQRPDVRLFAFFLDDYHVRRGNAMRSRIDMADFVRRAIAPQDMVGIMYPLTPTTDVVMGRNHEALARAIEQFDGRKYDYVPRNEFEERYANYPASVVEQVRNDVSLGALKGLIIKLGGLREGRKALILVSEGYTNYLPAQLRSPVASMPGVGNPLQGNESYGDNYGEQRERFFSQAEMMSRLKDVYDLANKNNVSIYALDPRGLAVFEHDINEGVPVTMDADQLKLTMDSIRVLADETDGRAIVNRNDLAAGMRQIIRDSSAYYLVGYNSKKAPADGRFHEIKVRVKRSGVEVRHRKGYWALTPDETARGAGTAKAHRAQRRRPGAGRAPVRTTRAVHQQLDRVVPRTERQDARDVCLGASSQRPRERGLAGTGVPYRGRRRWRAALSWGIARCRQCQCCRSRSPTSDVRAASRAGAGEVRHPRRHRDDARHRHPRVQHPGPGGAPGGLEHAERASLADAAPRHRPS